jgi:hypothetical protein
VSQKVVQNVEVPTSSSQKVDSSSEKLSLVLLQKVENDKRPSNSIEKADCVKKENCSRQDSTSRNPQGKPDKPKKKRQSIRDSKKWFYYTSTQNTNLENCSQSLTDNKMIVTCEEHYASNQSLIKREHEDSIDSMEVDQQPPESPISITQADGKETLQFAQKTNSFTNMIVDMEQLKHKVNLYKQSKWYSHFQLFVQHFFNRKKIRFENIVLADAFLKKANKSQLFPVKDKLEMMDSFFPKEFNHMHFATRQNLKSLSFNRYRYTVKHKFYPTKLVLNNCSFGSNEDRKIARRFSQFHCSDSNFNKEYFDMINYGNVFKGRVTRLIEANTKFLIKRNEPFLMDKNRVIQKVINVAKD